MKSRRRREQLRGRERDHKLVSKRRDCIDKRKGKKRRKISRKGITRKECKERKEKVRTGGGGRNCS